MPLAIVALLACRRAATTSKRLGGITRYMAAYDAKPDPALLYNIAQAHELAGHPEQALRF